MRFWKCILCLAASITVVSTSVASDWSHWRGPWQTGASPEKNLPAKFSLDPKDPENNLVWRAPYGSRSTPLILKGRVFIINNVGKDITEQERVLCLDEQTGKLLWEHKFNVWHTDIVSARLGWTNLAGDPATGNVYAHGTQGSLIAFSPEGKILWERSLTEELGRISGYGGRIVSPVVADDLVILSMNNSSWGDQAKGSTRFVALDKNNGKVVWWAEPVGPPKDSYYSNPVVAVIGGRKQVIGGTGEGHIVGLDLATGKTLWKYHIGTAMVNASPVVQGNYVYAAHGEENYSNNLLGRIACLDASEIKDGEPKVVWSRDGIRARYASPLIEGNRVYFTDDIGKMQCFDAKTGKKLWAFSYGRNARGSAMYADGKIYVGEVGATFHILEPSDKKCKRLFEMEFFSKDGRFDIEINGTPAAANGCVFFSTSEETYCIGTPEGRKGSAKVEPVKETVTKGSGPASVQIYPAEVTMYPGETLALEARFHDEYGNAMESKEKLEWSLPTPKLPPGVKGSPPPLKGTINDGKLMVDPKVPNQGGYVLIKAGKLTGKARIRVAPRYPYSQDFEKIPDGAVPGGWVNTQGKWYVKTLKDGNKVLAKVTSKASPLFARGNAYIGEPTDKDYTIMADLMGGKAGTDLPDMGLIANRYTLMLAGNIQKLRIVSWDALPRVDITMPFNWQPGVWYTMKLTVESSGGKAVAMGKCWKKGEPEPKEWLIRANDPVANETGTPALYGYVTGILDTGEGTDIFYDNVRITPNKK